MEKGEIEEALRALDSCVPRIEWRLRASARRRLETDILALCTGLRPVVMVDYGGKMPELQEKLCALLCLCHKETSVLQPLRVMIIEDMIYLIHVKGLADYVMLSPSFRLQLQFVDLEKDPPQMLLQTEQNIAVSQLESIQKFFSSVFSANELKDDVLPELPLPLAAAMVKSSEQTADDLLHGGQFITSQPSEFIDLSSCMQDTQVTFPTLNGWLLGYPVVYLFSKEHVVDAVYNLSTKPLNLFKIVVGRNKSSGKVHCEEELMSFTVPYDLSMGGEKEPWAVAFLSQMKEKLEQCKHTWRYLHLEGRQCM